MAAIKFLSLASGHRMPILGLGTYAVANNSKDMKAVLESALDNGYRMFDTAYIYKNESYIGDALKEILDAGKFKREEIFVTSKLPHMFTGSPESIRSCFNQSLSALKLDYIDLYLIHWPAGIKLTESAVSAMPKEQKPIFERHDHIAIWKSMEELVDKGLVRSIGLSNFNSKQISKIHAAARIPISNLQVECHAYMPQVKLHQFCQQHGIVMTAYSVLGSAGLFATDVIPVLLEDPVVLEIAKKQKRSPSQILLRFMVERGIAVLPKSSKPTRLAENSKIFDFELTSEEMEQLYGMNRNLRMQETAFKEAPGGWS